LTKVGGTTFILDLLRLFRESLKTISSKWIVIKKKKYINTVWPETLLHYGIIQGVVPEFFGD
jgi:hypothetical protein